MGHAAGDLLLCEVALRLRENVREGDIVARLGGDEFVIVQAEESQLDAAEKLADRLVAALSRPYRIFDRDVDVGASIGVAICGGTELEIDHMLRRADRALYSAKIAGRGRWHLSVGEDAPLAPDHAAA
jgi:diguanylate cyclase (GGDEF)-like protein